jgi:Flp pilus assembly protein TadG
MTRLRKTSRATPPHRSRGQALVEFAIVAPVFFLLLFAIIEAGRFILYYETLNNATREGTRYAIVNGANSLTCPTGTPAPTSSSVCATRHSTCLAPA